MNSNVAHDGSSPPSTMRCRAELTQMPSQSPCPLAVNPGHTQELPVGSQNVPERH
jgi:hypothetical protein